MKRPLAGLKGLKLDMNTVLQSEASNAGAQVSNPLRITLFNHKGGVGKTTLTANIAFALAERGKSVLLVDSDPQCDLTCYLLAHDVVQRLLDESGKRNGRTIWTAVSSVCSDGAPERLVEPTAVGNVALLPGDIKLAEFDAFMVDAWRGATRRRLDALRAITSISALIDQIHRQSPFDYVFYDTGPNIGALNRVLLLDSHFFIVPVACDRLSVRALATLGQAVGRWMWDADLMNSIAPDDFRLLKAQPALLGYISQAFRAYGQPMAKEAACYFRDIGRRVDEDVASVLREYGEWLATPRTEDACLGQVPDLASLAQSARHEGTSMWECADGTPAQRRMAKELFVSFADRLEEARHDQTHRAERTEVSAS